MITIGWPGVNGEGGSYLSVHADSPRQIVESETGREHRVRSFTAYARATALPGGAMESSRVCWTPLQFKLDEDGYFAWDL